MQSSSPSVRLRVSAENISLRAHNSFPRSLLFIETASSKIVLIVTFTTVGDRISAFVFKKKKGPLSPASFSSTPASARVERNRWSHGTRGEYNRQQWIGQILAFVSASNDSTGLPRKIIQRLWAIIYAESRVNCRVLRST